MEREVARVAAACDLRAFRYIPFPGIEFDPVPLEAEPAPVLVTAAEPVAAPTAAAIPDPAPSVPVTPEPAPASLPPEPEVIAPPVPPAEPAAPPPAAPPPAAPPPVALPAREAAPAWVAPIGVAPLRDTPDWETPRQGIPLRDAPEALPRPAGPGRRYRMLEDMAIESNAPPAAPPADRPTGHRPAARAVMPALSGAGFAAPPPPPVLPAGVPVLAPPRGSTPLPRGPRPRRAWPR